MNNHRCPNYETPYTLLDRIHDDITELRDAACAGGKDQYALELWIDKDEMYSICEAISSFAMQVSMESNTTNNGD